MTGTTQACTLDDDAVVCGDRRVALTELYQAAGRAGEVLACFRKAYGSPRTVAFIAYGVRLAVHRISGEIRILFNIEAVNAGVIVNPNQVRGQVVGGVVQGIGYALQEKMVYNADGAVVNPTLRNYRIPTFADAPVTEVFFADTYDKVGPLGAKSIAENTINPVAPAIGNALRAATGVRFTTLPFSEDRIFAELQEAETAKVKQAPEDRNLDRITADENNRHGRHQRRRLVFGKKPGPERADRQRHQRPGREQNADRVSDKRCDRRRQPAQVRIQEFELEHHDGEERQQHQRRRLPQVGGLPVTGSAGTQPGNDVSTRCAWNPWTRS